MNKNHWITILLDGSVAWEEIEQLLHAYGVYGYRVYPHAAYPMHEVREAINRKIAEHL